MRRIARAPIDGAGAGAGAASVAVAGEAGEVVTGSANGYENEC